MDGWICMYIYVYVYACVNTYVKFLQVSFPHGKFLSHRGFFDVSLLLILTSFRYHEVHKVPPYPCFQCQDNRGATSTYFFVYFHSSTCLFCAAVSTSLFHPWYNFFTLLLEEQTSLHARSPFSFGLSLKTCFFKCPLPQHPWGKWAYSHLKKLKEFNGVCKTEG